MRRLSRPFTILREDAMAFLEQRGGRFRLIFRYAGRRYTHTLKTANPSIAEGLQGGIEKTLMLLDQKVLKIPDGVDVLSFIVGNGEVKLPELKPTDGSPAKPQPDLTLRELRDQYIAAHAVGAMEKNSLDTVAMHLRHFMRSFSVNFPVQSLSLAKLQEHVNRRAQKKGIHKRPLSPATIRKEIASLRAAWNWAVQMGLVTGTFPNRGLKFPKAEEKPPFQTWQEIERQIARGVSATEERELWDCVFLTLPEIANLLGYVKVTARHPFIYPMFCFAAHTGARRSEILRTRINDVDLEAATVCIHERKRSKDKRTSRRVALTPFLVNVLKEWLSTHPGG
jgi:integrase